MIAANAAVRRCTSWVGRACVLTGLMGGCSANQEPKPPGRPTPAAPACTPSGENPVECKPVIPPSPRQSVALAVALRATGKSVEARRVLSLSLHHVLQTGHEVKAVPAWLGDLNEVRFVEPDLFVVRHSGGTSTVSGPDLRELTRCPVSTPISQLSARGRFAQVRGKPNALLDLQRCELMALPGTPLAFSPDERTVLATAEGALVGWDPVERARRWRQEATPTGAPEEPKAACVSPAGEVVAVVYGSGAAQLRTVATGALLRELRGEASAAPVNPPKARRPREDILHSCEFSPDGALLLVSRRSSNGDSPAAIVSKVWESASGRLLDTTEVDRRDYSNDLGAYLTRSNSSDAPRATLRHWRSQKEQTLIPAAATATVEHNRVQWVTRSDTEFCLGDFASATPQQCLPLAKGHGVRLGADAGSFVVSDANRHTIHRSAQAASNTVLLPCNPLAVNGQGRWVTCSQRVAGETTLGLWDTQSERSLPATVTTLSSAIGFRDDALCARGTCWSRAGEAHLPVEVGPLSPDAWVRPGYPQVNLEHAVAMGSDGLLQLATGQTIPWSWPASARSSPGSRPVLLEGVFDAEAARAWLLSRDGHVFVFSVADGRFIEQLDLPCRGGSELPHMTQVAVGRLIVRLSSGVGCSSLIDTQSFAVRPLPFSVGYNLALAGNGNRLAFIEKGEVSVVELATMRRVGGFTSEDAAQVGLSFDGLQVATTDWDAALSAYDASTALHVDFRAVSGAPPHSKKTVEFLREDCESCNSNSNLVQFERRVVAIGNRLFDYEGHQLASVAPRGRQVLVSFADGQVEVLGSDPAPAYSCLVGTEVLPSEFCAEYVERPGRTASLLQGGAPTPVPRGLRSANALPRPPLPHHCQEPVNLCGGAYLYDAEYLSCASPNTLDPEQLACLTELTTLVLSGTPVERFSREQRFERLSHAQLSNSTLSDLSPLERAHGLVSLDVSRTRVTDLAPLRDAAKLTTLNLAHTAVTDLGPLSQLTKLRALDVVGVRGVQLNALLGLLSLTELRLDPSMVDPAQLQQLRDARGHALRILDQNGQPLTVTP